MSPPIVSPQWWLAEIDGHGNATLVDGPHGDRAGVEKAAYLIAQLGLGKGKSYACCNVEVTPVKPKAHGANKSALKALQAMGLRP